MNIPDHYTPKPPTRRRSPTARPWIKIYRNALVIPPRRPAAKADKRRHGNA